MNTEKMTARINELYHKSKAEGLSEAEKDEQKELRQQYIANIKSNLRGQLNHITVENPDGTMVNLGEEYGNKGTN